MSRPLEGIRVADFSHVMAGPYATHLLSLLGAEVIKIEAPGRGDALRYYGSDRRYDGMSPAFIGVNAGNLGRQAAIGPTTAPISIRSAPPAAASMRCIG